MSSEREWARLSCEPSQEFRALPPGHPMRQDLPLSGRQQFFERTLLTLPAAALHWHDARRTGRAGIVR